MILRAALAVLLRDPLWRALLGLAQIVGRNGARLTRVEELVAMAQADVDALTAEVVEIHRTLQAEMDALQAKVDDPGHEVVPDDLTALREAIGGLRGIRPGAATTADPTPGTTLPDTMDPAQDPNPDAGDSFGTLPTGGPVMGSDPVQVGDVPASDSGVETADPETRGDQTQDNAADNGSGSDPRTAPDGGPAEDSGSVDSNAPGSTDGTPSDGSDVTAETETEEGVTSTSRRRGRAR